MPEAETRARSLYLRALDWHPLSKSGATMRLPRRSFLKLPAGAVALSAFPRAALAQAYPSKPIVIVVPYAPGGPTDTIARILAERMRVSLGQTVIVENTTGAGGTIGVGRVARSAPAAAAT